MYFEQMGKGMLCTYVLFDAASVDRNGASWLVVSQGMPKVHIVGDEKRNWLYFTHVHQHSLLKG
jgi:hypothetical protein